MPALTLNQLLGRAPSVTIVRDQLGWSDAMDLAAQWTAEADGWHEERAVYSPAWLGGGRGYGVRRRVPPTRGASA